ncbi:hypothetical protein E2C01_032837 [Portunus trituberculatus]|uniref:Uncharacterized protein n=1 Tax=Portunus trituberculatus TaxID=210409 RepID=A0A5B7F1E6_PORTR|nr:hypothetical protein [Portunus trituberculatus]
MTREHTYRRQQQRGVKTNHPSEHLPSPAPFPPWTRTQPSPPLVLSWGDGATGYRDGSGRRRVQRRGKAEGSGWAWGRGVRSRSGWLRLATFVVLTVRAGEWTSVRVERWQSSEEAVSSRTEPALPLSPPHHPTSGRTCSGRGGGGGREGSVRVPRASREALRHHLAPGSHLYTTTPSTTTAKPPHHRPDTHLHVRIRLAAGLHGRRRGGPRRVSLPRPVGMHAAVSHAVARGVSDLREGSGNHHGGGGPGQRPEAPAAPLTLVCRVTHLLVVHHDGDGFVLLVGGPLALTRHARATGRGLLGRAGLDLGRLLGRSRHRVATTAAGAAAALAHRYCGADPVVAWRPALTIGSDAAVDHHHHAFVAAVTLQEKKKSMNITAQRGGATVRRCQYWVTSRWLGVGRHSPGASWGRWLPLPEVTEILAGLAGADW